MAVVYYRLWGYWHIEFHRSDVFATALSFASVWIIPGTITE